MAAKHPGIVLAITIAIACMFCDMQAASAKKSKAQDFMQSGSGDASAYAASAKEQQGTPELNSKVLNFAIQNQGKQVGDGECWTLAAEALAHAGAKHARGYVFGTELKKNDTWLPGDIIQFKSCHFEETTPQRWMAYDLGTPNHTAIIQSNLQGKTVVLHQNFGNDRRVQVSTIDFRNLKSGSFTIFRPVMDDNGYGESDDHGNLYSGFHPSVPRKPAERVEEQSNEVPEPVQDRTTQQSPYFAERNPDFDGAEETGNPWSRMRKHLKNPGDFDQTSTAGGALGESIEIANGPMYQERSQLLARIRKLQSNGGEASQLLQMFQRMETRVKASSFSQQPNSQAPMPAPSPDTGLITAINTLNRLLSFRESNVPHHMQP